MKFVIQVYFNIIGTNLLTKFHEDRKINVAYRENALPPGSHVFQPTGIIFELVQDIIWMNLLSKFHEDRTVNVASRVKNAPPLGSHVFQANIIIFKLIQDTIETNLLTKFHEDWTINVASRFHDDRKINVTSSPYTEKCPAPQGGHVFQPTSIIFELGPQSGHVFQPTSIIIKLVQDIIGMNLLTEENAPPLGSHVFQANVTIVELIHDINKTNLLTIFHEDWTINVASRVLTRKNAPPSGGHVFQPKGIIFEPVQDIMWMNLLTKKNAPPLGSHVFQAKVAISVLIQDIIGTNLLSKFHEDWKINVTSRVKNAPPPWRPYIIGMNLLTEVLRRYLTINVASRVLTRKNAPSPGGYVFQPKGIISEPVQDIIGMNLLTKFHEDWTINVASREKCPAPPGGHVFQPTGISFELVQDIIGMNLLTEPLEENAPPLGSHVFQANTNVLTKFHEDWTINVAFRELTRQMMTAHDGRRTTHDGQKAITKAHHEHVALR
ncbi:hypothetical protein DPMN_184124 [Dreissena polymorpha]|uniref:Uncharacterized protein n=1 Tax=Dreissena polymorpha TaxID=45954 RepID=A0A9D4DIM0_DREPO|nr:hypothetical protein DPMN_184124 [Dreissena polymorpha]